LAKKIKAPGPRVKWPLPQRSWVSDAPTPVGSQQILDEYPDLIWLWQDEAAMRFLKNERRILLASLLGRQLALSFVMFDINRRRCFFIGRYKVA
jgi:hypothetical protein